MKKIQYFILVLFVFTTFIVNVEASFTCKLNGYTLEYNEKGEFISAKSVATGNSIGRYFDSDFHPKSESECPTEDVATVKILDGGRTIKVYNSENLGKYEDNLAESQKKEDMGGCSGYKYENSCTGNKFYSCIWNSFELDGTTYNYCNTDKLQYVQCGDAFDIPHQAPQIISFFVNLLKIATPIILIIVSIISLLKAISASNEDEIKKAQKGLIRKVIAAVMVFFVISIVQFVVMKVADNTIKNADDKTEVDNLSTCLTCFLNNDCGNNTYYKTNVFGKYECTYFKDINNPNADKTCPQDK